MFVIRAIFWVSIVVALIPVNPADLKEGQRPVSTLETIGAAQTLVSDLGGFCGRMEKLALQLQERRSTPAPEAIASIESAVRLLTHCSKSIRDGRPLPVELRQLDRTAMQLLGK